MPVSILMPALSPTMTEGNVAKWLKKVGDTIKSGDIIAEVETDKATMEVEAIDDGVLAKIIHDDGAENIQVNSLIGVISLEGEGENDIESFLSKKQTISNENLEKHNVDKIKNTEVDLAPPNKENYDKVINNNEEEVLVNSNNEKSLFSENNSEISTTKDTSAKEMSKTSISPLARRIASLKNINIENIQGTGPRGRIIKRDLDAYLNNGEANKNNTLHDIQIKNTQNSQKLPLTNIRKTIAKRLQYSKQTVPHFYLKSKVCAEEIIKAKQLFKSLNSNDYNNHKISFNDIIIKSVACALKQVPQMNATWNDDSILQYNNVDISIAVATDEGLFTPVIKAACIKSLSQISIEMKEFILKANSNKLLPEDYSGGSFSISNLGMYNVHEFSAIINPPQSGILAVGEIFEEPKIENQNLSSVKMINLVLSVDHRVADGAIAAKFLDKIKYFIEKPLSMLL